MLQAQNGRQLNLAAKTIRGFFAEKNIELKQSEALSLVGRLLGFSSYEAAKASLEGPDKGLPEEIGTWRHLAHAIGTLDAEQLNMPVMVATCRGKNGEVQISQAASLQLAKNLVKGRSEEIQAIQPVLAVELSAPSLGDDTTRVAMQFELGSGLSADVALAEIRNAGLESAIHRLNKAHLLNISLGDFVAYSAKNRGYWNVDFGFVYDKASATGYADAEDVVSFSGADDLVAVRYPDAQDIDEYAV